MDVFYGLDNFFHENVSFRHVSYFVCAVLKPQEVSVMEKAYYILAAAMADCIDILIKAMQEAEEEIIE